MNTAKIFEKTLLEDIDIGIKVCEEADQKDISLYEHLQKVALNTGMQVLRVYKQIAKCGTKI